MSTLLDIVCDRQYRKLPTNPTAFYFNFSNMSKIKRVFKLKLHISNHYCRGGGTLRFSNYPMDYLGITQGKMNFR